MRWHNKTLEENSLRTDALPIKSMLGSRVPLVSLIHVLAGAEYLNFRHAANALGVSLSSVGALLAIPVSISIAKRMQGHRKEKGGSKPGLIGIIAPHR